MTPADILVLSLLFIVMLAIVLAAKIHDQNITNEVNLETEINHTKQMIKLLSKTKELNAPKESSMEDKSVSLFDIIKDTSFLESDINPQSTQENSVYDILETGTRKEEKIINSLKSIEKLDFIQNELTPYSKYIQSITNPSFEKITRYCKNLTDENKADEMQKYLAENGKMHKALIYDALEQFITEVDRETLTIVDWGCSQGIASMLLLAYIREKQLDIEVTQVILIEDDTKALGRAMAHNQVFVSKSVEISGFDSKDKTLTTELKSIKGSNIIHIFANDTMPMEFKDVGFENLTNGYFVCISSVNNVFLEQVRSEISALLKIKILSSRDTLIGRFKRFERIYKTV